MKVLFHPKVTMVALIGGLSSIAGLCASVIASLTPLESVRGLEAIRPKLDMVIVVLGATAAICTAITSLGRSIAPTVDNPQAHDAPSPQQ